MEYSLTLNPDLNIKFPQLRSFFSTYSVEDKLKILKRCFEGAEFVRDVADELNITTATIYKWRRILIRKGVAGLIANLLKN